MSDHEFNFEIGNSKYREIADGLIKKFDELHHLNPNQVLFLRNHKSANPRQAKALRIPDRWRDILDQTGSATYLYVLEIYEKSIADLTQSQITALVYRELRRINEEGKIMTPDVSDWWQMIQALGAGWDKVDSTCPDILAPEFSW